MFRNTIEDFGLEIRDKASSLKLIYGKEKDICLKPLIISIIEHFEKQYEAVNKKNIDSVLEKWMEYSDTIGKDICVVSEGESYSGKAERISEEGRLIIRDDTGNIREVIAGEIKIRGSKGYWQ